jgi:hypothetical protein
MVKRDASRTLYFRSLGTKISTDAQFCAYNVTSGETVNYLAEIEVKIKRV